jgi:hypothetical protein
MGNDDIRELLVEREWRKCAPDLDTSSVEELAEAFEYWCAKYVYISFPGKGKIPFVLRDAQSATVRLWLAERYTVSLKARQIGFSTLVSIFCLWLCFFYEDKTIILISKGEREAKKLLRFARYAVKFLPPWMLHRGPLMNINQEKIEFSNDSVMESAPSAADPARGSTAYKVVVDEFGQLPNDEDAWASIEPVADQGGSVIMLGTANGEGNLFHKTWVGSKATWVDFDGTVHYDGNGTNDFKGIFHGWWTGGRDQEWYDGKTRNMEAHHIAQEYPSNPDEAFLKSGRPVFDIAVLRAQLVSPPVRGWLDSDSNGDFIEGITGPLRVWMPPEDGKRYTIGVDVAEGLEHGDYSSVHVIQAGSGRVVAHWHGHVDPDLLGSDIVWALGHWYNRALVLVESNNHGLTTLTALKRLGYFPLYHQKRLSSRDQNQTEIMGWRTTAASKPLMVDELNRMLRDGDVVLYDSETIAELRSFQRDERGKMSGVPHDDRVVSLAIAAQGLKHVHEKRYEPKAELGVGTVEWYWQQAQPKRFVAEPERIGAHSVAS